MTVRRWTLALLAIVLAWIVLQLQWAHAIAWDEVEFFRATRWVAEGRVPFAGFWEHHLPLQWFVFAPVAALADSPGVAAILIMRWAQVALWIAIAALLLRIEREAELDRDAAWIALLLLLASPLFIHSAIEYRVDVLCELAYFGALAVVLRRPRSPIAWIAFGALMSLAVLANVRVAPLVIVTGALLLCFDRENARWRWNAIALWMLAGIAAVASIFGGWLLLSGAQQAFLDAMRLNVRIDRILAREAHTLGSLLARPFTMLDAAAVALLLLGIAGAVVALRNFRRPGPLQLLAIFAIFSVVFVARLGVHYPYHLQMSFLLFTPLVASLLRNARVHNFALGAIGVFVAVQIALLTRPGTGAAMKYQDAVMREADRRTLPAEKVWDGVGFALHREPAYRYWFLPSVVRIGAQRGMLPGYDANDVHRDPPAAIVHSQRVHFWLRQFPSAAAYVTHHYIPLYRDLWLPGLSATVAPSQHVQWSVPRAGRYRLVASDVLAKHPWFVNPVGYPLLTESDDVRFEVELARLPAVDAGKLRLTVDGMPAGEAVMNLRKGAIVTLESSLPQPVGVLIVPDDLTTLFISPEAETIM